MFNILRPMLLRTNYDSCSLARSFPHSCGLRYSNISPFVRTKKAIRQKEFLFHSDWGNIRLDRLRLVGTRNSVSVKRRLNTVYKIHAADVIITEQCVIESTP